MPRNPQLLQNPKIKRNGAFRASIVVCMVSLTGLGCQTARVQGAAAKFGTTARLLESFQNAHFLKRKSPFLRFSRAGCVLYRAAKRLERCYPTRNRISEGSKCRSKYIVSDPQTARRWMKQRKLLRHKRYLVFFHFTGDNA